ncbi:ABC transporter permease [Adhaeribacter pallidiroseus]|uniref:Macrolide export ATP-binding/permease protein MacB n=1 Tax=Adhaeribacter pallidiroseus TaxID=2072847 RepID=A0A369QTT4_9BACT|nr:ABC transporter permease [Adhaeribacter pallidiroseus]RDC65568.1 Macrolide export ATP-binding/permease protein MacB [Adhaeribacter pallidiroseus]
MFRNYFIIALRNLRRHKAFSAINISGLALGMATCLLILLFVQHEYSYDRFNTKANRIVRVIFRGSIQGDNMEEAHVMPPVAQTLLADYPEVQEATRLRQYGSPRIVYGNKSFRENAFAFVDANFFQVFTLPFVQGDPKTALIQPNSIVISQEVARKFFGTADPMGKVLFFKDFNASLKVTGVIAKMPANAHFHFDVFASMASFPDAKSPSWMISEFYTYLVLPQGYSYKQLEAKLPQVVEKYMGPQLLQAMGTSLAQFRQNGNDLGLFLQPLTSIHLNSHLKGELGNNSSMQYIYIFAAVAVIMLLIAAINFMNLSTASASKRAKEVGIRKVLGSVKKELITQFLTESVLLTSMGLALAVGLVYLALPLFNSLAGINLSLNFISNAWLLPSILFFGLFVGVLAGSYPAFFLSSFRPVAVLKGRFTAGKESLSLRSGLVVFQFFISIALMIGTTVVYRQLRYIQSKELGYNRNQVLLLPEYALGKKATFFRQQLEQDARVVSVSSSGYLPAGPSNNNNYMVYPDNKTAQLVKTLRYEVDDQYIPTLGMKLVAGRNFSSTRATDSTGIILNEKAASAFGWGKKALGHTLTYTNNEGVKTTYRVIGVIKDFHFKSFHEPISPLVMTLGQNGGTLIVKTKTPDMTGLIATARKQWNALNAEEPFDYAFLDERFNQTYQAEQKIGKILGVFAGLTILVACLGLFGLATFTAEQRTKEIGIRKVLGASVPNIVALLSRDFLKLVLLANVIAWPLAGYAMHQWLQDFAYRVDLGWWVFALAGVAALVVALFTVSFQAIKAALANPVKSLQSE